jgi:hypothetical protein
MRHAWGFLTLERAATGWLATVRDVDGAGVVTCTLVERRFTCP